MKKQKRLLAFLMTVILMCSMLPITALAADPLPMVSIPSESDWKGRVFGDLGGDPTSTNFSISEKADKSVTIGVNSNKGKIATGSSSSNPSEGIAYYFRDINPNENFELSAKATVDAWGAANSQISFGIMMRSNVMTDNKTQSGYTGDYIALGALDQKMEAFYKQGTFNNTSNPTKKIATYTATPPNQGIEYEISIKKSGNAYALRIGNETKVINDFTGDIAYAGLYSSRNTTVTYRDVTFTKDTRAPLSLKVDADAMKKDYYVSDSLDLTGLKVTAVYEGNVEKELSTSDYIVSGFNNTKAEPSFITVNFNGKTASIPLTFQPLIVTGIDIKYQPAKTDYYPGEAFEPQGLTVLGQYNYGSNWVEMASSQYTLSISPEADVSVTNATYTFKPTATPGTKTVTVSSTVTSSTYTTLNVSVNNAQLTGLEVRELPLKTEYFVGDKFVQDGVAVYAKYSDNTEVKLLRSEFAITPADMSTAGTKTLQVSTSKGTPTAPFTITVWPQEIIGSQVTIYPRTTYAIGEDFDKAGMVVSAVYSSKLEELPDAQYTVNTNAFDKTTPGVYDIVIVPNNAAIPQTILKVTVVENKTYEWKSIRFGQSTSSTNNKVTVNANGSVKLEALEGGGKVTGDHDGITFYYTELDARKDNFELSADIKVEAYAKEPQDGQESFGIMARDAIGTQGDSTVFASNIAAIGGYSGGTTLPNGTQLFVRTGVTTPDGAGSKGIQSSMLSSVRPAASNTATNYKLTLIKSNNGFTGRLNNGTSAEIYAPDIMTIQDGVKMYVGFYTARLATIVVSNMELKVTSADTDTPMQAPSPQPVVPDVNFVGLTRTSVTAYTLGLLSNVNGKVTIKQGPNVIEQNAVMEAGKLVSINSTVTANTYTNFTATFVPDDTQYLTSYNKIVKNHTVDMKTYVDNGDIYVSITATSSGTGTIDSPLDLDTAIDYVLAGQKIILQDGRYVRTAKLDIKKGNDGRVDAMKYLVAAPGAKPIIDFDKRSEGVVLSGNYWQVKGIDFTRSAANTKGFTVGGSNNIVESSRFYDNGDTGLQISRTDVTESNKSLWPSNNLILNCESFDNVDPSNNNADGFAAKLTSGTGNIFRGDIAHNNIDDGWDLYTKAGTGAIGAVIIEDSIAYNNGTLTNNRVGDGDKNGFKLGGEGIRVNHIIRNSMAFGNGAYGFTNNSNPGVIAENNIGFNNARGNLYFQPYADKPSYFSLSGFVSYQKDYASKDSFPAELKSDNNYMFNGTVSANRSGVSLSNANFVSLTASLPYQRNAEGNIIRGSFLQFIAPQASTDNSPGGSGGSAPAAPTIIDGGVQVSIAPVNQTINGKIVAVVTVDGGTLGKAFDALKLNESNKQKITIDVNSTEGTAKVQMDANALSAGLKNAPDAVLSIKSNEVTYDLPAKSLELANIATALGTDESNVKINITIEKVTGPTAELINAKAKQAGLTLLSGAVDFTITAEANGKTVTVDNFGNTYVPRTITLVKTVDANQLTAVLFNPETGEMSFVPAVVTTVNGKAEVTIKRQGNSIYTVVQSSKTFDDVKGHWAKNEIELLASKLVIKGTSETTFGPNNHVTRAEFAALLVRSLGLKEEGSTRFTDVPANSWFAGTAGASAKAGLIEGFEDNTFRPNERITREQMAVMITRAMTFAGKSVAVDLKQLVKFTDSKSLSTWSQNAVAEAVSAGIVNGVTETEFVPAASATRAEAAVMLKRFLQFVQFIN
ncbi:S-layer homology domain-containing protein [Paenibacillus sp. 2RAB27]|uniref:S-layer homology domain-containing protein n=1 Tax=Paenibacillus sp. 2RAB27 TaxID=3232991 RepID=UPI003F9A8ABC